MTERKRFLDTNVVLYLLSEDAAKADRVEALLAPRPWISVQVLNEATNVCRRKLGMNWREIGQFLDLVRAFCTVVPLTVAVHDRARGLAEDHGLAFYDAAIVAAALDAGCAVLCSEDMHDGLRIDERLTIHNPFTA